MGNLVILTYKREFSQVTYESNLDIPPWAESEVILRTQDLRTQNTVTAPAGYQFREAPTKGLLKLSEELILVMQKVKPYGHSDGIIPEAWQPPLQKLSWPHGENSSVHFWGTKF